ncbi:aminotransferase class IV family protein [Arenibacterium sp. LLYu02]|uniref:aminotransferase class IV family protein n=1 Tax=Arenibacterium sp. LLYu02 TaxID=3404132 RepID=UPI003B2135DA
MESPFRASDDPDFRLIETFGLVPGQGVARLDLHLARLARSAAEFGIAFDLEDARSQIRALEAATPLRCRMTLDGAGALAISTAAMPPASDLWRFALAPERLNSDDPFLRHKTTRRALYDQARAQMPEGLDELVFLNERNELCEGTITNIILTRADGRRVTPPLTSGCLPGVYRQSLLDAGAAEEAILTLADLQAAKAIHLTNSLRGEIPALLA